MTPGHGKLHEHVVGVVKEHVHITTRKEWRTVPSVVMNLKFLCFLGGVGSDECQKVGRGLGVTVTRLVNSKLTLLIPGRV